MWNPLARIHGLKQKYFQHCKVSNYPPIYIQYIYICICVYVCISAVIFSSSRLHSDLTYCRSVSAFMACKSQTSPIKDLTDSSAGLLWIASSHVNQTHHLPVLLSSLEMSTDIHLWHLICFIGTELDVSVGLGVVFSVRLQIQTPPPCTEQKVQTDTRFWSPLERLDQIT